MPRVWGFIVSRVLVTAGMLVGVITLSFLLIHLAPGDAVTALVGEFGGASPQFLAELRERFGLDRPLVIQYGLYLWNVLHGDLGQSFRFQMPVARLILERLPATLLLLGASIVVFTALGVLAGVYAATHEDSVGDHATRLLAVLGYSVPVFWLAQLFINFLAVRLAIFPVMGIRSLFVEPSIVPRIVDILWHLVLPATALGLWNLATTQRFMRTSLVQALQEDYIRTARSKGLASGRVIYRHAMRNALLPVVTMTGLSFATMLAGAALTETVFSWPGLGRLMFEAVAARDRPVLLGLLLTGSIVAILADAVTDAIHGALDPRVGR